MSTRLRAFRPALLAAVAGASATALILAGCTSGGESTGTIELTFANFYTGPDIDTVNAMVEEFNETHDGIVVTNQAILGDTLMTELPNLVAAGKAPDIEATNDITHPIAAAQGALQVVDDADLEAMGLSQGDFFENIWDLGTMSGELYGVPFGATSTGFYYNNTLMAEKGITEVPTDLDGLIKAGQLCTTDTSGRGPNDPGFDPTAIDTYGYGLPVEFGGIIGAGVLAQFGGELYDDSFDVAFDSPEGEETLELLSSLTSDTLVGPAGLGWEADVANFRAGKSCFFQSGVWELKGMQDSGLDFGITTVPQLGDQRPAAWGGAAWLTLPKQDDNYDPRKREAALEFIGWMTSAEGSLAWTESGNLTVRSDVADSPDYADNPTSVIAQSLGDAYIPTGFPWVVQINNGWNGAYSAVLSGSSNAADALAQFATEAESGVADARENFPEFSQ